MIQDDISDEAVGLLQELGLQEYEAKCFLALTKLPTGTAKEIHDISGVPRTRVYDAMRVLESKGLVEVHHSSPQEYRSVGVEEAVVILRQQYTTRIESLRAHLEEIETVDLDRDDEPVQEVWSMAGHDAIEARTLEILNEAEEEIAMIIVDASLLTDQLLERLHDAAHRGVTIILGGETSELTDHLGEELPNVQVFETDQDWFTNASAERQVAISRILLVDRETLLIGSYYPGSSSKTKTEQAIFARGLENGVIVLLRRLLDAGRTNSAAPG